MNKLFPVLLLATILLTSTILTQEVLAKSKNHKAIDKGLDKFSDKKKWTDLCSVSATKKDENKTVWTNSKCGPIIPPPPVPPKNKSPIVQITSPIKGEINQTITINATISDIDGFITLVNWLQVQGAQTSFISTNSSLIFIPTVNDTYKFNVKATDNNGSSTAKDITVNVGSNTPPPPPPPPPSGNVTKIAFVGDISGNSVANEIQTQAIDHVFTLGDNDYGSSLSSFKTNYVNVFGNKLNCVIGNHESANEDGTQSKENEARTLCGDQWLIKIAGTAFVGFNSNGDVQAQLNIVKGYDYSDVNNVVILSHKPCHVFPNAHHPVEAKVKAFCDGLEPILQGKNIYEVSGHNHNLAKSADGKWFVSGAGGRSHYVCDTDSTWTFCNNQKYGFLEFDIDKDGNISTKFLDTTGSVVQ